MIIGIDEAGRGALAGPVVVCAAAILNPDAIKHIQLRDSKAMTKAARVREYRKIQAARAAGALAYNVCSLGADFIDDTDVLSTTCSAANFAAMYFINVFADCCTQKFEFKVDGNYNLLKGYGGHNTVECIVKGDTKVPEIMLASIVAKCVRDDYMTQLDKEFSGYDFANSKGYASAKHMKAIQELGPCPMHRKTFKRVKEYVSNVER